MNKIKSYYWYVGIPIAAVALGTLLFFDLIVSTVAGNPHPEVNYVIFILIVAGCAMMWQQVSRMNRDAQSIEAYYEVAISNPEVKDLRKMLAGKRNDTHAVFEIITDLIGKPVSSVQHAALEAELDRYKAVQMRYLILPNFMSGMMVGLGLLGTFIGLLGALAEISKLIGAFSLATSGDPVEAIRILVERLTSPMQAMGVAFSASLFGVLGSLVMGVLLVGVRNCAGELNSLLDTRVTYLTDFGRSADEGADTSGLSDAVSALAEQSPILTGLIKAMDQSERRVRDLISSVVQISSRLEMNQASNTALVQAMQSRLSNEAAIYQTMQATQDSLALIATRWSNANQIESQMAGLIQQQTQQNERFLNSLEQSNSQHQVLSERLVGALAEGQTNQAQATEQLEVLNKVLGDSALQTSEKLGDIAGVQRRGADQVAEILQNGFNDMAGVLNKMLGDSALQTSEKLGDIAGVQRRGADQVAEILQNGFNDMAGVLNKMLGDSALQTSEKLGDIAGVQRRGTDQVAEIMQNGFNDMAGVLNKVLGDSALQTSEKLGDIAGVQRRGTDQVAEIMQNGFNDMAGVLNKVLGDSALQASEKLGDIAGVQRRGNDQVTEILQNGFKDLAGVQRRSADTFAEATETGLRELAGAQRRAADEMNKELARQLVAISEVMASGQAEQALLTQQMNRVTDVLSSMITTNQTSLQRVVDTYQRNFEMTAREQTEAGNSLSNVLQTAQNAQLASLKGIDATMNQLSLALRADAQTRSELANRIELQIQDYGARQEVFAQSVLDSVADLAQRITPKML